MLVSKDTNDIKPKGEEFDDKSEYASNNYWRVPDQYSLEDLDPLE